MEKQMILGGLDLKRYIEGPKDSLDEEKKLEMELNSISREAIEEAFPCEHTSAEQMRKKKIDLTNRLMGLKLQREYGTIDPSFLSEKRDIVKLDKGREMSVPALSVYQITRSDLFRISFERTEVTGYDENGGTIYAGVRIKTGENHLPEFIAREHLKVMPFGGEEYRTDFGDDKLVGTYIYKTNLDEWGRKFNGKDKISLFSKLNMIVPKKTRGMMKRVMEENDFESEGFYFVTETNPGDWNIIDNCPVAGNGLLMAVHNQIAYPIDFVNR